MIAVDILVYEILTYLDIKEYIRLRILSNTINTMVLEHLPNKLVYDDTMIDTDFAKLYPQYLLTKNVIHFEYHYDDSKSYEWSDVFVNLSLHSRLLSEKFLSQIINNNIQSDILMHQRVSEPFIEKYLSSYLCSIFMYQKVSESFIEKYIDLIDEDTWEDIFTSQSLSESFIERHMEHIPYFSIILTHQVLSESFLDRHIDRLNTYDLWEFIFKNQKLSESYIEKHMNKIQDWNDIFKYQILSEPFIDKHIHRINNNYFTVMCYQQLSVSYIEKHIDLNNLDYWWYDLLQKQSLSERLLDNYIHQIPVFDYIIRHQKVSESFIEKHINKVTLWEFVWNQKLSLPFIIKHKNHITDKSTIWIKQHLTIQQFNELFIN